MKKIVILLALSFFAFGCGKDNTNGNQGDSLVGTIWVGNFFFSDDLRAIEFTSETNAECYSTDEYLGKSYPRYGTYKRNGNNLTFDIEIYSMLLPYKVVSGTISGEFLNLKVTRTNDKGETQDYNFRLIKKQ